jgi:hypothetical protein
MKKCVLGASSAGLFLVAALALCACHRRGGSAPAQSQASSRSYARVAIGMSRRQVYDLLGPPSGKVSTALVRKTFGKSGCFSDQIAEAFYYYRQPNESFVIFTNEHGTVICKEKRLMAFAVD